MNILTRKDQLNSQYPGNPSVIHGNGAIAEVMGHVCGGVIGYPITPSTEISEIYEAFRSGGGRNVWGKHPFFFEPEGVHSAQSGALGAALTGGKYISNASSSQGILYGLESHYVTVGKKVGGFVLQIAARVVSKHSLNVMAGHDDVYALLQSGYTILFGSNSQEAADLAAIAYKLSALSLIPVANAMDGFTTSHMMTETMMPEPELLQYLTDPRVEVYILVTPRGDEGLLELDFRIARECELGLFGVAQPLIGSGAGRRLMNHALEIAWSHPIERFWLHTCSLDHPSALAFYRRTGFTPYARKVEVFDDPRYLGLTRDDAAPQVPIL